MPMLIAGKKPVKETVVQKPSAKPHRKSTDGPALTDRHYRWLAIGFELSSFRSFGR
jgi:hypothetical protein